MALDGGSIKDTEGRSQRFFSLRSMLFGLEKPMLEGSMNLKETYSRISLTDTRLIWTPRYLTR